uniref:Arginine N-methyltransferase family protein n=1 Tax=Rhizophora mucronata TaxID=61149 RepID=A0A2P2ILL0_RHIMU
MNIGTGNWCDHWKQCVWLIPGKGVPISRGEEVLVHAVHDDTSVCYNLAAQDTKSRNYNFSTSEFHLTFPPERLANYGDSKWRFSMMEALRNALQSRVQPICVVADDSVFLTLLAAHLSKISRVMSLFPGLRDRGAEYVQTVADENGFSANHVEIIQKKKPLTLDDTDGKKVDLLIGEPYYHGNDISLPWQNLRFWKDRTMLDSVLSEDFLVMPCKAILMACAMSLPDLWKSRRCLRRIEGFDHSVVNTILGACGELPAPQEGPLLPLFIWQCGEIEQLSKTFMAMEFDFSKPMSSCHGKVQVELSKSGICHGFALWIDWVMDPKKCVVISTGPDQRYWKQAVKLLAQPVAVGVQGSSSSECCSAIIEASFDPSSGEITLKHSFS